MPTRQITGTTVTVPPLGDNITEVTVTRWLKRPGEEVTADEPLLEVATDKVDSEIPAPAAGTLLEILAAEDEVVPIGGALALIGTPDPASESPTDATSEPPHISATESGTAAESSSESAAVRDVAVSAATTPDGSNPAIGGGPAVSLSATPSETGVTAHIPSAQPGDRVERLPRIRQTIARRMLESLQTSAQLTTVVEADVTRIARLRDESKADFLGRTGVKLSFLPFFTKAAIEALAEHPVINAAVNADCTEVTYHAAVHLGMAVDSSKGLMVPVIRDAQKLNIPALAQAITENAELVRSGRIGPDTLSGGTFTITNTGSRGALFDTPIVNQPQSAVLGMGAVAERVVPQHDSTGAVSFGVRSMVYLSLSYDHRIIDGADAARYLATVRRRLDSGFTAEELV
ncbi:putative dihydrolipoamide acyltransferase [Nocardia nova SH22a]|uniref:Dihydrolipoamide acetyltransferase component of pyruvate dehydrogenase complex n=1 Tax=Nocardia nova SH22a TaxID=1415166 RepID=W5TKK3_9NOCA|nr:2-oxo acid dehydrogenase subunit E2 [Nocardia nova]AHH19782.1 putative dihydrolipoamide acyltransferase [Nocardia nova SH22a]